MLIGLFSAKGSPGVTSSALVLAAVWPRRVILLEADPTGSDFVHRCRSETGTALAASPSILGLASAIRGSRAAELGDWTQRIACGVDVITGVATPSQARGLSAEFWRALAMRSTNADADIVVDLGRLNRDASTLALANECDVLMPVVSSSVESLMHTRELLRDMVTGGPRIVPLLLGPARTAAADATDFDEVLAAAGVVAGRTLSLPLDHPGLTSLEAGAKPSGRGRSHLLIRAAKAATEAMGVAPGFEVRS